MGTQIGTKIGTRDAICRKAHGLHFAKILECFTVLLGQHGLNAQKRGSDMRGESNFLGTAVSVIPIFCQPESHFKEDVVLSE